MAEASDLTKINALLYNIMMFIKTIYPQITLITQIRVSRPRFARACAEAASLRGGR